jgi:hypothetical protein
MKELNRLIGAAGLLLTALGAAPAGAAESPKALLCAITHTVACDAAGNCTQGPAGAVNLPVFMNFDLQKREITSGTGVGERRTSKITHAGGDERALVLLGADGAAGWSVTIDKGTGDLTGGIATGGTGYLIFGSCLPH